MVQGSGKTYLCSALLFYVFKEKEMFAFHLKLPVLEGLLGGLKLAVPLLDKLVSSVRTTSNDAEDLRKEKLIIIDEVTILTKML